VNLNTITEVRRVTGNGEEDFDWREGDSWLAGGTWLFSEPQPHLRRLLNLHRDSPGIRWWSVSRASGYPPPARSLSWRPFQGLRSGRPHR